MESALKLTQNASHQEEPNEVATPEELQQEQQSSVHPPIQGEKPSSLHGDDQAPIRPLKASEVSPDKVVLNLLSTGQCLVEVHNVHEASPQQAMDSPAEKEVPYHNICILICHNNCHVLMLPMLYLFTGTH